MNSIEQGATGGVQDPAIVVRELSVHGVELDELRVRRGEIVALLGANGTGKSTVSRVLVGATAAAGSARVLGLDPTDDHAELKCRIGFLIQDLETMGSLSSRDVLDICAAVRGCSASYAVTLAERIALDLDRPMGQLCRGQLRRLGVVQALMHRPEVIVLDDPTAELDAPGRLALAKLLREAAAWGAAVLITVTTAAEAAEYADRTATFDRRAVPAPEPAAEPAVEPAAEAAVEPAAVPGAECQPEPASRPATPTRCSLTVPDRGASGTWSAARRACHGRIRAERTQFGHRVEQAGRPPPAAAGRVGGRARDGRAQTPWRRRQAQLCRPGSGS